MKSRYFAKNDFRFAIAISSLVCVFACPASEATQALTNESPQKEEAKGEYVGQKVLAFNLEGFSEKGDKKWEIQGESAETLAADRIKLNNIVAKTYGDEAQATLKADTGIYDRSKNNVILQENVKVTIDNSEKFAREYADMPMMAQAPKKTTAASKEAVVSEAEKGTGLAGETVITCDAEVEFNYEANTAVFSKNVKVASSDGVIEADRITLFLDIKTKKIKEVVAEGNVKITRGDNTSYSDKATYMETDKKVVLSGNPRIVFYQEGGVGEKFLGK